MSKTLRGWMNMDEMNLSNRLKVVSDFIPSEARLADIGSDHAYLPCYAFINGIISKAIAGEVNEGPYQSALQQVKKLNLVDYISVRLGNGLDVIQPNEVDCITIAGMGGPLISEILEAGKSKLEGVSRLVLQPNVGAQTVREWLVRNGWELKNERILEEAEKIYEVLVAERGDSNFPYHNNADTNLFFGPFLLKEKNAAFVKKWTHELEKLKMIHQQLSQAQDDEKVQQKKQEMAAKIFMIEEALK